MCQCVLALGTRQLGHAQRRTRVRHYIRRWVVDETSASKSQFDLPVEALPVASKEVGSQNPLGWILRVQIKGEPLDLSAEPALKPLGRTLADTAERSDVIRPDQKLMCRHTARLVRRQQQQRAESGPVCVHIATPQSP
jgi:hypothetical protein